MSGASTPVRTVEATAPHDELERLRAERDHYKRLAEQIDRKALADHAELSQLIRALQQTEDALRKAGDELERAVAARTADVVRANDELRAEVAERARAEAAARESEAHYRLLMETSPDAITVVDPTGFILTLNQRAVELFGHADRSEALGRHVLEWVPEDLHQSALEAFARVVGGDVLNGVELELHRHGERFWAALNAAAGRDASGEPQLVVIVSTDITDRKRAEADRLKSQKLESLGVLAAGIAHDFNNLLAAILGNLGLALEATTAPAPRQLLEEAERSALRARALTRQLLTFSRGGQPVKAPISIARVLAEAAQMGRLGTAVGCDLAVPGDLWHVEADEGQLAQVFNNLVVNAVQAMPAGGTVTLRAANVEIDEGHPVLAPGRHVRVEVTDTGVGIPQDLWTKVFDPYFTTKPTGSGLGLAVAYAVVKHHEGAIDLASTPGHGTTFTVHLPACAAAEEAPCATRRPVTALGGRVLVMDDEAAVRRVAVRALETFGCEVEEAADGAAAIGAYARAADEGRPFDLVLVDLTIPGGMGGEDAVARMREIDPGVVAIVSSGYSGDAILSDYAAHGFSGVLPKPYRVDALRAVVADALEARASRPACHVPHR